MNRPPTTRTVVLSIDRYDEIHYQDDCDEQIECAWEAAFCEWLIEQGLMPDSTEFDEQTHPFTNPGKAFRKFITWFCEDKTK